MKSLPGIWRSASWMKWWHLGRWNSEVMIWWEVFFRDDFCVFKICLLDLQECKLSSFLENGYMLHVTCWPIVLVVVTDIIWFVRWAALNVQKDLLPTIHGMNRIHVAILPRFPPRFHQGRFHLRLTDAVGDILWVLQLWESIYPPRN